MLAWPPPSKETTIGKQDPAVLKTPYVSFVSWGRNDSYTPEYAQRARRAVSFLAKQLEAAQLDSEIIFVEWNPVQGKPKLIEEFGMPEASCHVSVRGIVVDSRYHMVFEGASERGIHAAEASNVGLRRARGRFATPKASDTIFSNELVARIAHRNLDPGIMYRVNRHDIVDARAFAVQDAELLESLAAAESECNGYIQQSPYWKIRDLHTNACGDFTLMATERWHQIRGHALDRTVLSLDVDSIAMHAAAAFGVRECRWPDECRVYKPQHNSMNGRRISQQWLPWQRALEQPLVAMGAWDAVFRLRTAFEFPRRRVQGVDSVLGPSIEKNFLRDATDWAKGAIPSQSQPENWGLADEALEIRTLCTGGWERAAG